jgi:hypothetical protein
MKVEVLTAVNITIAIFWNVTSKFEGWESMFSGNLQPLSSGRKMKMGSSSEMVILPDIS